MAAMITATMECRIGPTMRAACDVLELVSELLDVIPDWHGAERDELRSRAQALYEIACQALAVQQGAK